MAKTKLKDLLSEVFEDVKPVDKHQVIEWEFYSRIKSDFFA